MWGGRREKSLPPPTAPTQDKAPFLAPCLERSNGSCPIPTAPPCGVALSGVALWSPVGLGVLLLSRGVPCRTGSRAFPLMRPLVRAGGSGTWWKGRAEMLEGA